MTAFWGEVIGTMLLIIFGAGVCAGVNLKKSLSFQSGWIVVVFGWGLGVAMAAYAVGGISGAHLNPALTIALAFVGDFPWKEVPVYIAAQMIGAIIGAVIIYLHYLPHWKSTDDPAAKLGVFLNRVQHSAYICKRFKRSDWDICPCTWNLGHWGKSIYRRT